MTLLELMLALNKHYPDDRMLMAINQTTGKPLPMRQALERAGDTLAVFLVNEIYQVTEDEFLEDGHLSEQGWDEINLTLDWIQAEIAALVNGVAAIKGKHPNEGDPVQDWLEREVSALTKSFVTVPQEE